MRIAIAKDKAFNFYYSDNIDLMNEAGITLIGFSPLKDEKVPDNIDGLYFGGGFPEVFAEELSGNKNLLKDIKKRLENGLPAYAECGGLLYLSRGIKDFNEELHKMVGFFNCNSIMTKKLQRFGYAEVEYEGIKTRAHEFHYSLLEEADEIDYSYKIFSGK